MRTLKALLIMALACMLCLGCIASAEENVGYNLGDKLEDFSVTTWDGQTFTLSEVLKEKEAVLINIWATWCGPCRNEFPYMEEAYEQYSDRVEIIALSCEPTDTPEVLEAFVDEMGLTFKVGQDTLGYADIFAQQGIPTSLLVDRYGTICFIETGSQPDVGSFTRLFDAFVGEDYTESVVLDSIPGMPPTVEPSDEADLASALNVEGGALVFTNGTDKLDWPMLAGEKDGRSVVVSSNTGMESSLARVNTVIDAKAGDVVAVTFKVSSCPGVDVMQLLVNDEVVKAFGGEKDWMTYAYAFDAEGEYSVSVTYLNDSMDSAGEDTLWVDSIAHLTGDEAAAALAANPVYPVADEMYIRVLNENARQIVITDPTGTIEMYYGDQLYLVSDETVYFEVGLPAWIDPEMAILYFNYDGSMYVLSDCCVDGRYLVSCGCDSLDTTGYSDSSVYLYPSLYEYDMGLTVSYFKDEENVNATLSQVALDEFGTMVGSWMYADGTLPSTDALPENAVEVSYESTYTVKYVDQDGNPVPGVMCQVCDEETCQVFVSDDEGVCEFTLEPYAWEIHTLMVPEGYEGDTETVTLAPVEGGELTFTLTKK